MIYTDAEQARHRANQIGCMLNELTNYGRRALPEKYRDLHREWEELSIVHPSNFVGNKIVDIREAAK